MDLQGLVHDRRFQLAAAATAAVGGFVWYKRRKGGASTAGTSDAATSAAGYQQAGTLDTSGTDIANWLGQYSGSLQNQLDAYAQSLQDAEAHLQQLPTSGSTTTGTTPPGTGGTVTILPVPPGPPTPRPPAQPAGRPFVTVTQFVKSNPAWSSTLSGIAAHTGVPLSRLRALNPSISNPNVIRTGQKIYTG